MRQIDVEPSDGHSFTMCFLKLQARAGSVLSWLKLISQSYFREMFWNTKAMRLTIRVYWEREFGIWHLISVTECMLTTQRVVSDGRSQFLKQLGVDVCFWLACVCVLDEWAIGKSWPCVCCHLNRHSNLNIHVGA